MLELKKVSFEVPENGAEKEIIKDISFTIPDGNSRSSPVLTAVGNLP